MTPSLGACLLGTRASSFVATASQQHTGLIAPVLQVCWPGLPAGRMLPAKSVHARTSELNAPLPPATVKAMPRWSAAGTRWWRFLTVSFPPVIRARDTNRGSGLVRWNPAVFANGAKPRRRVGARWQSRAPRLLCHGNKHRRPDYVFPARYWGVGSSGGGANCFRMRCNCSAIESPAQRFACRERRMERAWFKTRFTWTTELKKYFTLLPFPCMTQGA